MQLNKVALGLAFGILLGVCVFLATIWVMMRGGGEHLILLTKFYLGYSISFFGAIVGLIWGFVEGFIGGFLLAWLYNTFAAGKSE